MRSQRHVVGIVQHHHWLEERFDSPLHALVHALQVRGLRANGYPKTEHRNGRADAGRLRSARCRRQLPCSTGSEYILQIVKGLQLSPAWRLRGVIVIRYAIGSEIDPCSRVVGSDSFQLAGQVGSEPAIAGIGQQPEITGRQCLCVGFELRGIHTADQWQLREPAHLRQTGIAGVQAVEAQRG